MINALRYEPQGQRQRFGPREQQSGERQAQDLHIHLNITFWARQGRSTHPSTMRIARLCAALLAATVMPFLAFIFAFSIHDGPPDPLFSLNNHPFVLLKSNDDIIHGTRAFDRHPVVCYLRSEGNENNYGREE
jgi:hypothetical protein